MMKTPHDFAKSLTEDERQKLIEQLEKNLADYAHKDEESESLQPPGEVLNEKVQTEMKKLGFWQRLLLTVRAVFTSQSEENVFLSIQVGRIYKSVQNQERPCIKENWITAAFAQLCYDFFLALSPFLELFSKPSKNPELLQEVTTFILEKKIPNAKSTLLDFMNIDELENQLEEYQDKRAIQFRLSQCISQYFQKIPLDVFRETEEKILFLYRYRALVLFDYKTLFTAFEQDATVNREAEKKLLVSKIDDVLEYLEMLYSILHSLRITQLGWNSYKDIFDYIATLDSEKDAQACWDILKTATTQAQNFLKQSQLINIIRIAKANPYYKARNFTFDLQIRAFYYTAVRLKIIRELDAEFSSIRGTFISRKKQEIFTTAMEGFSYYRRDSSSGGKDLPVFRYANSLQALYWFLKHRMQLDFMPTLKVFGHSLSTHSTEFLRNLSDLEELLESIRLFEQDLAPLTSDGKRLRLLYSTARRDYAQMKFFRQFIFEKDEKAEKYLIQGMKDLKKLSDFLSKSDSEDNLNSHTAEEVGEDINQIIQIAKELDTMQQVLFYEKQIEDEVTAH